MHQEKNLTLEGITGRHFFLLVLAVGMMGTCLYLTSHYMDVHFPAGITGKKTMCDISNFWNCDAATLSKASNIAHIPISLFGLLFSSFIILGSIFSSPQMESTNKSLALVNIVGCLGLLVFSLIELGSMCPMCTLYYLLSGGVAFLYMKFGVPETKPDLKMLLIYLVLSLIVIVPFKIYVNDKLDGKNALAQDLIRQYNSLQNIGDPKTPSRFRLASIGENFSEAPLRMTIFSDFQCPACKALSDQVPDIIKKYQGKINIQYFFYPLDHNCNDEIKRPFHTQACKAAYLSICKQSDFGNLHDEIFHAQSQLSDTWISQKAKSLGVEECMKADATRNEVLSHLDTAKGYNIRSTPTFLLNGVKIEGVLPNHQLFVIMDDILKKNGK